MAVLTVVVLVDFVMPTRPFTQRTLELGAVDDYARGSVTTFRVHETRGLERLDARLADALACREQVGVVFHLARLEDGRVLALSARSPHLGEFVPWLPDFEYDGQRGWFRECRHGETFALDGTRVFGPAPRDLDRYAVEVTAGGRVRVDLRRLTEGARPSPSRGDETPTPAATPWPTATTVPTPVGAAP